MRVSKVGAPGSKMGQQKRKPRQKQANAPLGSPPEIRPGSVYTFNEAMAALRIGYDKLRTLIDDGAIPVRQEGRRLLIEGKDMLKWLRSLRAGRRTA